MPIQAPPIDPRSYDDIVAQTEKLAYRLAGWTPTSRVLARSLDDVLFQMTLDEDLRTVATVALRGAPVDAQLARSIAVIMPGREIRIRRWVAPRLRELVGGTLDEQVFAIDGTLIARNGTTI